MTLTPAVVRTLGVEQLEVRDVPASSGLPELPGIPEIDAGMQDSLQAIYQQGLALGNRPNVFAKAGDSITADLESIRTLGSPTFNPLLPSTLGLDPELAYTAAYFRQTSVDPTGANSFNRMTPTAQGGNYTIQSLAGLPQELQTIKPSVLLVQLGTNDLNLLPSENYGVLLAQVVQTSITFGVIPVLTTLPPATVSGGILNARIDLFNSVVREVGEAWNVPVWDLHAALVGLPNLGISADGVHLSASPNGGASFTPVDLQFGYNVRNLGTVQVLTKIRQVVFEDAPADRSLVYPDPEQPWIPLDPARPLVAVGLGAGATPYVRILETNNESIQAELLAYEESFAGGVEVALGDVTGDGRPDLITAPGPGGGPVIKVFDGLDGSLVTAFFAYTPTFRGGASVAVGDVDGDGLGDVLVGAGAGGGPHVRVFRGGDYALIANFMSLDTAFRGGIRVAAGDTDGDGTAEILVGAGAGGGPRVNVFEASTGTRSADFFVGGRPDANGVALTAADVDGDGRAEVIAAPGRNVGEIWIYDAGQGVAVESFPIEQAADSGTQLAVLRAQGERRATLVTIDRNKIHVYEEVTGRTRRVIMLPGVGDVLIYSIDS